MMTAVESAFIIVLHHMNLFSKIIITKLPLRELCEMSLLFFDYLYVFNCLIIDLSYTFSNSNSDLFPD